MTDDNGNTIVTTVQLKADLTQVQLMEIDIRKLQETAIRRFHLEADVDALKRKVDQLEESQVTSKALGEFKAEVGRRTMYGLSALGSLVVIINLVIYLLQ
jgi:hypothetical protein